MFSVPIYGGTVLVCCTREEWSSLAVVYDSDPETDGCKGLAIQYLTPEEGRVYAIGVFDNAVDTLVHELDHTTFNILGDVGVLLEDGGANESHTYLLGWLVREVFPVFEATVRKRRNKHVQARLAKGRRAPRW